MNRGQMLLLKLGRLEQHQLRYLVLITALTLCLLVGGAPEGGGSCSGC